MKTITLTLLVLLAALACVASVSVAKDDWRRREKYEDKYEEQRQNFVDEIGYCKEPGPEIIADRVLEVIEER